MRWVLLLASTLIGCASVRPVEPGAVYRASPLSAAQLEDAIHEHQIRTVVNLGGCRPHRAWYRDGYAACEKAGARQIDLTIDPRGPDRAELIELLDVYRTASRPLLLVGRYPGDDVGFAAGFYRLAVRRETTDAARSELPFWQSYRWPAERISALDRVLVEWRGEAEFYRNYRIAEANPDALIVPAAGNDERNTKEEPVPAWRQARKNEIDSTSPRVAPRGFIRKETAQFLDSGITRRAGSSGMELGFEFLENGPDLLGTAPSAYAVRVHRKTEVGTVLRDYSAVIIDGPVSNGPLVSGRTRSSTAAPYRPPPAAGPKPARLGPPQFEQ